MLINSALVSAQNRQRLYWVGKRNADGTYSKVNVEQPIDRGILLKDIINDGCVVDRDKAHCLKHQAGNARDYFKKHHTQIKFEPVNTTADGKSQTVKAQYQQNNEDNFIVYAGGTFGASGVAEPVNVTADDKSHTLKAQYYKNGTANFVTNNGFDATAVASKPLRGGALPRPNGELSTSQAMRVYSTEGKSVNITSGGGGMGGKTGLYAIPVEFDGDVPTKAISQADGKTYRVHKVENGVINIKSKDYPIKLADGYYIIRKLTVRECMRLQTVPEWYEFPVSDSSAYRLLGNGWTCLVIEHLINACLAGKVEEPEIGEQIKFF